MRQWKFYSCLLILAFAFAGLSQATAIEPVGTASLTMEGDLAAQMVAGIGSWLDEETARATEARDTQWISDEAAKEEKRAHLRDILGVVDERAPTEVLVERPYDFGRTVSETNVVRWRVVREVWGEGYLLLPNDYQRGLFTDRRHKLAKGTILLLGDCDWTPENVAGIGNDDSPLAKLTRDFLRAGCRVLVPTLIDRTSTYSNHPSVDRKTNQPHREYVYRPAYQMGRHIIGYEVQKVLAAVDWLEHEYPDTPLGIYGYGEGGLVAFYAAAVDTRLDAAVISGYFAPREDIAHEPIYRNVWSLLRTFGDAEIANLILPRPLIIEASPHPAVTAAEKATPGIIATPPLEAVRNEFARAKALSGQSEPPLHLVETGEEIGSEASFNHLLQALMIPITLDPPSDIGYGVSSHPDPAARMHRQVQQLLDDTQWLLNEAAYTRAGFWKNANAESVDSWASSSKFYREYFRNEIIGSLPPAMENLNARTRQILDEPNYTGHEVVLDVLPEVIAYGILLIPKNIGAGERRPVVVCQHGLEGRPQEVALPSIDSHYYHKFGCQLADQGYIVFAPQNPYIGEDNFRLLQRTANPLKLSLFSFIVRQHEQILAWLKTQPYVDPQKMAFYGLSYGGKTAMRVPALVSDYCLSICSGDYNEWIWKTVSTRSPYSYQFTGEYEMYEFNLGNHFNYAELSWLIFPRPFMVERGHDDGVAPDDRVAQEYARTRYHYDKLGLGERTEIEFFNGPHTINGVGTFEFLRKHLRD